MRRFLDFLPAVFCTLYLEYLVSLSIMMGANISPVWGLGFAGPPLGLLFSIILFARITGFWRRFSRFKRCLLLALATVGIASIPTGILVGFDPGLVNTLPGQSNPYPNPFLCVGDWLFFSAIASIIWFPLALVISGLYCFLFWAWEGRRDANHFAGPVYRPYLLGILLLGFILVLGFFWQRPPAAPAWINIVSGDVDLLSLAAGKAPDGTDVVLAGDYYHSGQEENDMRPPMGIESLDARDGHLRWMQQYPQVLRDMASGAPWLGTDPDGDVLVGWNSQRIDPPHPLISKLSGVDGHIVWERKVEAGQLLNANLETLTPDGQGRIWVAGLQAFQSGLLSWVIALLDARDGTSHWEKIMQVLPAAQPWKIFPLKDGDAFWILSAFDHNSYTPVGMQRVSGKDGATQWEIKCPSQPGDWFSVVDEAHHQVVIFSESIRNDVTSYDLLTGKIRWRAVDDSRPPGRMLRTSLDERGNLVLWRSGGEQVPPHFSFLAMLVPLPLSLNNGAASTRMRSVREVFSNADGTLLQSRTFADPSVTVEAILSRPGSNQVDALLLRDRPEYEQSGHMMPWRAVFLNRYFWQDVWALLPGGPEADWRFSYHAILTPSGKLVIAVPFGKDDPQKWKIAAW